MALSVFKKTNPLCSWAAGRASVYLLVCINLRFHKVYRVSSVPTRDLFTLSPSPAPAEPAPKSPSEAETTEAASTYDQADMETKHTGPQCPPKQKSWLARHFSLLLRRDRQAQKAGQLFSGLLAVNVVFLGGAFICSMIFNKVSVTLGDVWILLAALKVLSLLWLLCYTVGTTRKPHAVLYRDPHAGPIWVRGEYSVLGGWRGWGSRCLFPSAPLSPGQVPWCSSAAVPSA